MLTGLVLVLLAAFAPWALLRLLPLAELASSAAGHLGGEIRNIDKFRGRAERGRRAGIELGGLGRVRNA